MSLIPYAALVPGVPAITPGVALGTGGAVVLAPGSSNLEGRIAATTGGGNGLLAAGLVMSLTFSNAQKFPNGCIVVFSPGDANFSMVAGNLYATDRVDGVDLFIRSALNMGNTTFTGYYRISGR